MKMILNCKDWDDIKIDYSQTNNSMNGGIVFINGH